MATGSSLASRLIGTRITTGGEQTMNSLTLILLPLLFPPFPPPCSHHGYHQQTFQLLSQGRESGHGGGRLKGEWWKKAQVTSLTGEMAGQERQRMLLLHCHPLLLLLIKVSFSPPALMEETLRDEIQRISKTPWTNRVNDRIDLTMHYRQLHALNFWHGSLGYQAHWQQPRPYSPGAPFFPVRAVLPQAPVCYPCSQAPALPSLLHLLQVDVFFPFSTANSHFPH